MTLTSTPYRSSLKPGRDTFGRLLRAEWSKFWTVRVWALVLALAAAATVVLSLLGAGGAHFGSGGEKIPLAPDGTRVVDAFRFVHQPLAGDGSITARVTDLTGVDDRDPEPWAKAGVLVKQSTKQGSPYAALMITPDHGVRLQWNFTHDKAGSGTSSDPRWLRLTRSGDRLTGYESPDGTHWSKVGSVTLPGLTKTAQAGLFVATPPHTNLQRSFGSSSERAGGTSVAASFDHLGLTGGATGAAGAAWTSTDVGLHPTDPANPVSGPAAPVPGTTRVSAGVYHLTGRGDIAPDVTGADTVQMSFQGVFVGALFMAALGALFITSEYKRDMIRTTFAATPRRGRVLAAKSVVIGGVTFGAALTAVAIAFPLAQRTLRTNGYSPPAFPELSLLDGTPLRAVVGSAALLALVAVLALALGTILRSSAGAITLVVVLVTLPQILSFALPLSVAHWLLRLTPAAAFAIQQGAPHYPQVDNNCLPEGGCYPLTPWNGLAVLGVYVAVALALAAWRLRRRDA